MMIKSGFSYLKLTAAVAVLAIAIIGLNGLLSRTTVAREKSTTTPREIGSLEEKVCERATAALATEGETTTPAVPTTEGCNLSGGGVKITAINRTEGIGNEKIEVGWDFTMPPQLAALSPCVALDSFDVQVKLTFKNDSIKIKSEKASPLARNAVVRFTDLLRDVKSVSATVFARYKFDVASFDSQQKNF